MRVSVAWLREYADLPAQASGRDIAERLVNAGLEVEAVETTGEGLTGPLVVGRVLSITELTEFKKPIRHCLVEVGEPQPRSIVCGARNFAEGDLVVVALPGAVLPGDFAIASRTTYGHVSDGMICSTDELGLGGAHDGIIVLPPTSQVQPGQDARGLLGLGDEVLDIAVTADRGYCLSIRGVAREAATAFGVGFREPAADVSITPGAGYPVRVEDSQACPVFVAVRVRGLDPQAGSPLEIQAKVRAGGMRPISLAVDVTNLVMLELGQPLHAYDAAKLTGPIVVRRAQAGETLTTLDGTTRTLDVQDVAITDDSGAIGVAGVMGGQSTEISETTTDIVLESAHFAPSLIARSARRHKLPSEASRRFERGVDPALPLVAARYAAELIVAHAGGVIDEAVTVMGQPATPAPISMPADLPDRIAGCRYGSARVRELLEQVGCMVDGEDTLTVTPPTWRSDLTDPADLVEEVARLHGYDAIESVLPQAPAGRGLTAAQTLRRQVADTLTSAGFVETLTFPFVAEGVADALMLPADDPRRQALRVANPLSEQEPLLRTSLLPGLMASLTLNRGRGMADVALTEIGSVFTAQREGQPPVLPVDRRPTESEVAELFAAVPQQPQHAALIACGTWEPRGWWGPGRAVSWADAVHAVTEVAANLGVCPQVTATQTAPWHPGRCAQFRVGDTLIGHAGELHPRVIAAFDLPERTVAAEIDLDALLAAVVAQRESQRERHQALSVFPASTHDLAVIVDADVPVAQVADVLRKGGGEVVEDVRLFDCYTGDSVGQGKKSLTFALRFRAQDHTLTAEEMGGVRESILAAASNQVGAVLRS